MLSDGAAASVSGLLAHHQCNAPFFPYRPPHGNVRGVSLVCCSYRHRLDTGSNKYSLFLHTQTLCLRIVDPCMELRIGPLPLPPFPGDTYRASNATGVHKITCMQTNVGERHAITRQHGIRDCQAEQTQVAERHMESIILL